MHPFYGPSAQLLGRRSPGAAGLVSMAAYLAFWAGVVALGIKMANDRFPPRAAAGGTEGAVDDAVALLRRRYAAGELERESFLQMCTDLASMDARPLDPVGRDPR